MSLISNYDEIGQTLYTENLSKEAYTLRNDKRYQPWRQRCLKRDKNRCKCCKSKAHLHVHHIYNWQVYPLVRFDPANGITLCSSCHRTLHAYQDRKLKHSKEKKTGAVLIKKNKPVVKHEKVNLPEVMIAVKTHIGQKNTVRQPSDRRKVKIRKYWARHEKAQYKKKRKRVHELRRELAVANEEDKARLDRFKAIIG